MEDVDFGKKYGEVRAIVQEWADKQGHDRCWYYPDLFRKLVEVLEISPLRDPALPSLEEFQRGCEIYQKEEYNIQ